MVLSFIIHAYVFVLGLVVGSFANVLILRVPAGESIGGRSHCPRCGRTLGVLELIPVIGYLILRGRCFGCQKHISFQYPLIEFVMGCLFLSAFTLGEGSILARSSLALFFALLLVISVVDLRSQMIPDVFNLPLIALGILYGILVAPWLSVGIAALVPVVFFGAQWIVSRGRWVGSGDILLGCALGAALHDWRLSLLGLMWAYMAGALITLPFLIAGTVGRKTHIPFGPFLALGSMLALFVGRVALEYLLG